MIIPTQSALIPILNRNRNLPKISRIILPKVSNIEIQRQAMIWFEIYLTTPAESKLHVILMTSPNGALIFEQIQTNKLTNRSLHEHGIYKVRGYIPFVYS